jgi:LmbE family N-acetylglucosaminyl deacetylase
MDGRRPYVLIGQELLYGIERYTMRSAKIRLIVMAHPDDPELACGGTSAKWIDQGDTVYYIIVSCGEKGTWNKDDSPFRVAERREGEAERAAEFLGVKKVIFLRHPDGDVVSVKTLKIELAALIRKLKPHTIVTHDPWRIHFHPDHRATGYAVIESIMIARDFHFYPFLLEIGLEPYRPEELLFTPSDKPTFVNDITETFDKKMNAIKIHVSQLKQLPHWEERITSFSKEIGKSAGYDYGEGFLKMRV